MAQADIDGFRISIDAQLANDLTKVDKALAGIAASGGAAGTALSSFAKSVNEINLDASKMSSLKTMIEGVKTALDSINSKTLQGVNTELQGISQSIKSIDESKLANAFKSAENPAMGIVTQINEAVNRLAQLPNQVRAILTGVAQPIEVKTNEKKPDTGGSQFSADTTKVLEAAFERMDILTNQLVDKIKSIGTAENTVFTELRNDIQGVTTALQGLVEQLSQVQDKTPRKKSGKKEDKIVSEEDITLTKEQRAELDKINTELQKQHNLLAQNKTLQAEHTKRTGAGDMFIQGDIDASLAKIKELEKQREQLLTSARGVSYDKEISNAEKVNQTEIELVKNVEKEGIARQQNIAYLTQTIALIERLLKYGNFGQGVDMFSGMQQYLVDVQGKLQSLLKEQRTTTERQLANEKKANEDAAMSYLKMVNDKVAAGIKVEQEEEKLRRKSLKEEEDKRKNEIAISKLFYTQEEQAMMKLKSLYAERIRLEKESQALSNKATLNIQTGGKTAALTQDEIALARKLREQIENNRNEISQLINTYGRQEGVARIYYSYELEALRQKIELQRQYNSSLDAQRKTDAKDTKKANDDAERKRIENVNTLNKLYQEQLRLTGQIGSLNNQRTVVSERSQGTITALSPKQEQLAQEYAQQLAKVNAEITRTASLVGYVDAQNAKESTRIALLEQEIKLQQELDKALEKVYAAQQKQANASANTSLSASQIKSMENEYARLLTQMDKVWEAHRKMGLAQAAANAVGDTRTVSILASSMQQAEAEYRRLANRRTELENETQLQLDKIRETHERKRGEQAVKDFEKAEKEKTEAAKKAAKERADAEKKKVADYKSQNLATNTSLTGAIEFSKTANTINRLQTALKYLQDAMSKTKPNTSEWYAANKAYQETKTRLDKIKQSMEGMKSTSQGLLPSLQNLAMQLGIVFSVQQLGQWIKHMTEVRAQFELQQIALRSIIQDKQKADEVFAQVQQLALKSPFSIMQLNTYTKQIAAYGVEAEKLVGTTKMLADVSAGLGVDMGRLILAYGQVKTANFLRATEVRQFTEAGLNITQELANYFTELNGKMVTAGEVTEMITKRMVKFEDVAEVFKRVTSAGGMFYDMQEKQAEGLHGQMQRIGDAYSIMLNDIGKSNEGTITTVLSTIRQMISSWRSIASFITVAAKATVAYIGVAKFAAMVEMLNKTATGYKLVAFATNAATAAQLKNNAAVVANPYALAAAAIAVLVAGLYEWATATDQLTEDLQRMQEESFADATDSVAHYKELADTVRDVTKSYSERKDAMDEIQRAYGDILPKQQLEMEGIMAITDGYKDATEAIREYYRIKLEEEEKSKIEADYSSKFTSQSKGIADIYANILKDVGGSSRSIQGIIDDVINKLKDGSISNAKDAGQAFVGELVRYYNITDQKLKSKMIAELQYRGTDGWVQRFGEITRTSMEYKEAMGDITGMNEKFADITDERTHAALQLINKDFEQVEEKVKKVGLAFSQLDNIRTLNERAGGTGFDISKLQTAVSNGKTGDLTEEEQKVVAALQEIDKALASVGMTGKYTWQQIYDATANNLAQMEWFGGVQKTVFTSFKDSLNQAKYATNELAKSKFTEELQAKIDGVDGSPTVREIKKIVKAVADANNLDYHLFDWLTLDVKTSFESAGKEFDTQLKAFKEKIHAYKEMMKTMYVTGQSEQDILNVLGITKEQVQKSPAIIKAYEESKTAFGNVDKETKQKKSGSDKTEQTLRERIQLLKEANQTYEKYAKEYDKVIAKEKTHNDLMERAKELNIAEIFEAEDLTNTATLDAMQKVYDKFKSLYENKKYVGAKRDALKSMSEMEFEIGVEINKQSREDIKRQLDNMMGGYQLVMELDKSGVDTNLAQSLFNIDYTNLDDIQKRWEQIFLDSVNKQYAQMDKSFVTFKSYEEAKQKLSEQTDNENYKIAIDAEKKITEAVQKEYETRMKEYTKYLKKSYSESVNVQVEAYSKLSQIQKDFQMQSDVIDKDKTLSDDQKAQRKADLEASLKQITDSINKEMKEKLGKVMFETFKSSDVYTEMFGDLSKVGSKTIDVLIGKINELKGHMEQLSPKQIKELAQYEEKLFEAKAERDPFGEYLKALKEVNALRKQGLTFEKIDESIAVSQGKIDNYQAEIDSLNKILAAKQQNLTVDEDSISLTDESKKYIDASITELETWISVNKKRLKGEEENLQTLQNEQGSYKRLLSTTEKNAKAVQEWGEMGKKATSLIRKGMEAIGGELDEEQAVYFDMVDAIIECGVQAATFALQMEVVGVASKQALGIIGYILIALEAIISVISAIAGAKDAQLKKKIEEHKRAIDRLKESYDDLSDAISNAFSQVQYASNVKEAQRNLQEQNQHLQEMIAAENDRKKADKDQIADWEKQIRDNIKEMKQQEADFINELGGLGAGADIRDSAQNFVDAWFDAFNETGDGLSGLTDEFDDFIRNIVKKQAYMTVASHWIDKFADMINNAFNQEIGTVNYDKMREAMTWMTTEGLPQMDSFLEDFAEYFEQMGVNWNSSSSKLSGLAQGIQGVTEETAQIVEALLNSMRYYVADTNAQLRQMVTSFINPPSDNVFLTEMRAQTTELRSIHSTLKSLVKGGHPRGGSGVKVFTT